MKNHKKSKHLFSLSILALFICGTLLMAFSLLEVKPTTNAAELTSKNFPKLSTGDFNGPVEIYIKNNWTATNNTYDWCTGAGTENDPFVINGLHVNGSKVNVCLVIQDTREYFTIKNSSFYDSADGGDGGGLVFNNVTNGNITDIKIFNSYYGIWLNDTSDMWIEDNRIYNNKKDGILLQKSEGVHILDNLIKNSTENGIFLVDSDNNNMSYNVIHINTLYGVHLDSNSDNNGLSENYLGYNTKGCWKDEGEGNVFDLNDCIGNYEEEPVYADYEPTDLTPIIIGVLVALAIIFGLIIFVKFGVPVLKENYLGSSRESSEKELEKQV